MLQPHLSNPQSQSQLPRHIAVLVLDDMRFDRHRLHRLCSGLPMDCDIIQADSLAALELQLASAAFDLIFVDYNLPDGTGLDALELIRSSARNEHAASIMVTGFEEESIALDAMSRGCSDYITKDELSPAAFERSVTNALQKSVLATQVQAQTFARTEVEQVLQRFATQCATDIKPMISRMMRQLRNLRDAPAAQDTGEGAHRENLEASCAHLWEFLEELEKHQAGVIMKGLVAQRTEIAQHDQGKVASPTLQHAPKAGRRRPPSPFSRMSH